MPFEYRRSYTFCYDASCQFIQLKDMGIAQAKLTKSFRYQ